MQEDAEQASVTHAELAERTDRLASKAREAAQNTDRMSSTNADARQSAMALGNIMSDLPHGPAAAANNIGNLVEGFGQMNTRASSFTDLMKAMVGPALLGGMITGVATLAANWDRVSQKIESAASYLSGATEAQLKLNKAVREMESEAITRIGEEASAEQLKTLRRELLRIKKANERSDAEQSAAAAGAAMGRVPTTDDGEEPQPFTSEMQKLLVNVRQALEKRPKGVGGLTSLLFRSGLENTEALSVAQALTAEEEEGGGSGSSSDTEITLEGPAMSEILGRTPGLRMYPMQSGGGTDPARPPLPDSIAEQRELRLQEIRARSAGAQARIRSSAPRSTRQSTGPLVTGVTLNRRRRLAAQNRRSSLNKVSTQLQAARTQRLYTDDGTDRQRKLNARIKKLKAKRRGIERKHGNKLAKIRQQENRRQEQINNRRVQAFRQFTGNISSIGNAMSSLYSTWRKQRVQELKREGKSQKEINKQIEKEGKRRFKRMKKIRIAAAVADTIASSVSAFRGTMQQSSYLGPAALPLAISAATSTAAAGYARVRKLQALSIGGGVPGRGGAGGGGLGSTAKYSRLGKKSRNSRVQNFAQEQARDRANISETIREEMGKNRKEMGKTRSAVREGMAIGDEDAFETQENADDYAQKATS
jgi:hypothetical protein